MDKIFRLCRRWRRRWETNSQGKKKNNLWGFNIKVFLKKNVKCPLTFIKGDTLGSIYLSLCSESTFPQVLQPVRYEWHSRWLLVKSASIPSSLAGRKALTDSAGIYFSGAGVSRDVPKAQEHLAPFVHTTDGISGASRLPWATAASRAADVSRSC